MLYEVITIFEDGTAATNHRQLDLLFDDVVGHEHILAALRVVKAEEIVLAIGSGEAAVEFHSGKGGLEGLEFPGLQVIV